jgi:hypothetical protein
MVHILVYIHAATVPQTAPYLFIVFSIGYLLGRNDSGSIICTAQRAGMGDALINPLNYLIYLTI